MRLKPDRGSNCQIVFRQRKIHFIDVIILLTNMFRRKIIFGEKNIESYLRNRLTDEVMFKV